MVSCLMYQNSATRSDGSFMKIIISPLYHLTSSTSISSGFPSAAVTTTYRTVRSIASWIFVLGLLVSMHQPRSARVLNTE